MNSFTVSDKLMIANLYFAILIIIPTKIVRSVELTFELEDNAKNCFYEHLDTNITSTLEYQVVSGGQYDVDVSVMNPAGISIYNEAKSQYNTFNFEPSIPGVHAVCFSNEFSTFAHKVVYMDWIVGEEELLPHVNEPVTVMTLLESKSVAIREKLNKIIDYQTHHRLREATNRKFAEDLNATVFRWCLAETILLFASIVGQVLIIKNFFGDSKRLCQSENMK